jgi:hypothetical protein
MSLIGFLDARSAAPPATSAPARATRQTSARHPGSRGASEVLKTIMIPEANRKGQKSGVWYVSQAPARRSNHHAAASAAMVAPEAVIVPGPRRSLGAPRPPSLAGTCLQHARERISKPRQRCVRPRHRPDAIGHLAGSRVEAHFEDLFTGFGVVRQRAVRESKRGVAQVARGIHHTAAVQRPESEVADGYRHDRPVGDAGLPRMELDPAQSEVPPFGERGRSAREDSITGTDGNDFFVHAKAGRTGSRQADGGV